MAQYNWRNIKKKFSALFDDKLIGGLVARQQATSILRLRQQRMLEIFENHPVTQEIAGGADGPSLTSTLGGKENLYSFIGFDHDPIPALRRILQRKDIIRLGRRQQRKSLNHGVLMTWPILAITDEELESKFGNELAMPEWSTGIWPIRIATGISGLGYYLRKLGHPSSRSGGGIQISQKIRSVTYKRTTYLSDIFAGLYQ